MNRFRWADSREARADEAADAGAPAPSSRVRGMEQWRALDSIVQTSTIELFRSYEVTIAPVGTFVDLDQLDSATVGGGISFSGRDTAGELLLAVPNGILATMGHTEPLRARDWVKELANQLLGRVKNRLVRYEVRLQAGVPFGLELPALRARLDRDAARVYMFRSLRGVVFVALRGTMVPGDLRFKGAEDGPAEGDLVVF